jgi:hypothetical protein
MGMAVPVLGAKHADKVGHLVGDYVFQHTVKVLFNGRLVKPHHQQGLSPGGRTDDTRCAYTTAVVQLNHGRMINEGELKIVRLMNLICVFGFGPDGLNPAHYAGLGRLLI